MDDFKKAFVSEPGLTHLNNAGLSRISKPAAEVIHQWTDRFLREGIHCNDEYLAAVEKARLQLALFAACDPGEIAFFQSTAGAVSQVAFGLALTPQDEVLLWDQEYGSNLYPWVEACKRSGAQLKTVESPPDLSAPLEKLLGQVTGRTKVIAISWVQYQTGSVTDLKTLAEFARPRGILTVVDVIQGLGARPFNFQELGIDFACGGSHKWMVTPVGVGFLIARQENIAKLRPLSIGMKTYGDCNDATDLLCKPRSDAGLFESGSKQVLEIVALGASAELLRKTSAPRIQEEADHLGIILRHGLKDLGYQTHENSLSSKAFVNFSHTQEDIKKIAQALTQSRIGFALRGPGVRLSPHAHNSEEDIYKTLHVLKTLL